jgi:hypothetical protein
MAQMQLVVVLVIVNKRNDYLVSIMMMHSHLAMATITQMKEHLPRKSCVAALGTAAVPDKDIIMENRWWWYSDDAQCDVPGHI